MYAKKTIQYENIFTPNEYLNIKPEIYKQCVLLAHLKSKRIDSIQKRMRLVHEMVNGNSIYEYIIMSNFIFKDNEEFINMLINKGLSYDDLKKFTIALEINKRKKNINYVDALNSLASIIYKITGVDDYNIIYNKISQVIAFDKELYKNLNLTR